MDKEEVIRTLLDWGLQRNEVEVYLLLTNMGVCPVGTIARKLGTNRMSVYRTLKALEEKRLVESTMERPSKAVALPITGFLDHCIDESKTRMASLLESKKDIVEYFARLHEMAPRDEEPRFRIVQGRKQIFDQIFRMLAKVRREACVIQTANGLYRFTYGGIDDGLKKLSNAGVEVMILTNIDESSAKAVKNFAEFAQVRHTALPNTLRLVLVDDAEALTTFSTDDSMSLTTEKDLAMWVRAPDYVKNLRVFFEALWREASLARPKLLAIETRQWLMESLSTVQKTLDSSGWTTTAPGKLTGESGVEHVFDMVATYSGEKTMSLVIDLLPERSSSHIMSFSLKGLDVNATLQILLTKEVPSVEESELASRRGIMIASAKDSKVAMKVLNETKKILRK